MSTQIGDLNDGCDYTSGYLSVIVCLEGRLSVKWGKLNALAYSSFHVARPKAALYDLTLKTLGM
jgi:hypothetical protein